MPEITIVVPVYQAENYLSRCVDSLLGQTFVDFELLLVDDGSTDGSGALCRSYAERDPRVRYLYQENRGPSSARNLGMEMAEGSYLMFADSDDYVDSDILEHLYGLIRKYDADLVVCRVCDCYQDTRTPPESREVDFLADTKEGLRLLLEANRFSVFSCAKLYRTRLLSDVRYPEYTLAEDGYFIIDVAMKCRRIAFSSAMKYYYLHRENSLTTNRFRRENLQTIQVWTRNRRLIDERYPELAPKTAVRCCWAYFQVLGQLLADEEAWRENPELCSRLVRELLRHPSVILRKGAFTRARQIAYLALFVDVRLYRRLVLLMGKKRRLFS